MEQPNKPRIYLAGPDVFLPDPLSFFRVKCDLCAAYGFDGVSPFDNELGDEIKQLPRFQAALRISAANEKTMESCRLLIANLTPFRGPSADVGTAYELGFFRALGRPVFAYTNVADSFFERTRRLLGEQVRAHGPDAFEDGFGMLLEHYDGCTDNLMLVGAVHGSGTRIIANPTPPERLFTDLTGFKACLQLAARHFGISYDARESLSR